MSIDGDYQAREIARLTAQRDALLAACEGLVAIHDSVTQRQEAELRAEWLPKARAAISQARGRA